MSWSTIIGQQRLKQLLQRAICHQTVGSAYLFLGPTGRGTDALAIEFAKVLNCLQPQYKNKESVEACDHCRSCRQMATLQHPNLHLLFPLPTGERNIAESPKESIRETQRTSLQQALEAKAVDYYRPLEIAGAQTIKIHQIRELRRSLSLSAAVPTGRRVVLVFYAEQLTTDAANALLKSLEEPLPDTTFLLIARRSDQLLPTLVSRCQLLRSEPLSEELIARALQERDNIPQTQAELFAHLADGDYDYARAMIDTQISHHVAHVVDFLRAVLRPQQWGLHVAKHIEALQSLDRSEQIKFFQLVMLWLRAAWEAAISHDDSRIPSAFQQDVVQKFIHRYRNSDFPAALTAIADLIDQIQHNHQLPLSIYHLVFRLRRLLVQNLDVTQS